MDKERERENTGYQGTEEGTGEVCQHLRLLASLAE